ncbi:MAG TPA: hypothetical protein HA275_01370 [Halobacteriales archaeon]|nr:hypothetical protein [Halobacteriales archaeon]
MDEPISIEEILLDEARSFNILGYLGFLGFSGFLGFIEPNFFFLFALLFLFLLGRLPTSPIFHPPTP